MSYTALAQKMRARKLRKRLAPAFPVTDPRQDGWGPLTPAELFARVTN